MVDADDTVECLTTKEIKALARPEFAANPEKFYPVTTLKNLGFSRAECPKCKNHYWRHSPTRKTCGDSNCDGRYSFIGAGTGKGKKITYAQAWKDFEASLTSTRIPCTSVKRYPVVARWRNDVDYVAAGIFCFQPYCVTGELDPPANPLIQPQFCLRFNDLDNIGITGRHYSGFIMVGIQVFNSPGNFKFFKEEAVEFNYRWLTETLNVDPDDITFVEDVWAGGGNLGPSIEYFVGGLEVGNMVFMQYKTFHDGSREELDVKVIDTGIGLERIVWLYNGSPTSYMDTFKNAFEYFKEQVGVEVDEEVWSKFGPYSCTLNIDEVDDIEETWKELAKKIDMPVQKVKDGIQIVKDMYIVLDHTRSVLLAISDGSLPSNVGGGGNVRNIFRRTLALLKKNGWWEKLRMEGLLKVFELHKRDLEGIFGPFPEYKSFDRIIQVEYDRWLNTDAEQGEKLKKLLKKNKNKLTIADWITAMQSWGIPADKIAEVAKVPIPGNLYYEIAMAQERVAKAPEQILYNTLHLPETRSLYFDDTHLLEFEAKVIDVFANVRQKNVRNLLILDQSCFYPTSGGQLHDTGKLTIQTGGGLTVKSSNAEIEAALEEHGRKRGIEEFDMLEKVNN
jgi:alanyl-tRNA synthetase